MAVKNWFIYALVDPRDQQIRYVGFTSTTLKDRLKGPLRDAKARTDDRYTYEAHRCRWIRALLNHTGRITPPEVRAKMSATHKAIGAHSQQHRENQRVANKRKKLSDQDIREIRSLINTMTNKDLGAKYGVCASTVQNIKTGRIGKVVK